MKSYSSVPRSASNILRIDDLPQPGSETMIGVIELPIVLMMVAQSSMVTFKLKLILDIVFPLVNVSGLGE
jgi:hypothetical protein